MSIKEVCFGTVQEAFITPKPGHELERVVVINTVDNQVVPSEVSKVCDNPLQYKCSFVKPAVHVNIKPVIKPIMYSVTIEENELCNIVFVEKDSAVDVEIKDAFKQEEEDTTSAGFNTPQHSFNDGGAAALDVEGKDGMNDNSVPSGYSVVGDTPVETSEPNGDDNEAASQPVEEGFDSLQELLPNDKIVEGKKKNAKDSANNNTNVSPKDALEETPEQVIEEGTPSAEEENKVVIEEDTDENGENGDDSEDVGGPDEDSDDDTPITMLRSDYDKKCTLYWEWQDRYNRGDCPEEKWNRIRMKHNQLYKDIDTGKIVLVD